MNYSWICYDRPLQIAWARIFLIKLFRLFQQFLISPSASYLLLNCLNSECFWSDNPWVNYHSYPPVIRQNLSLPFASRSIVRTRSWFRWPTVKATQSIINSHFKDRFLLLSTPCEGKAFTCTASSSFGLAVPRQRQTDCKICSTGTERKTNGALLLVEDHILGRPEPESRCTLKVYFVTVTLSDSN